MSGKLFMLDDKYSSLITELVSCDPDVMRVHHRQEILLNYPTAAHLAQRVNICTYFTKVGRAPFFLLPEQISGCLCWKNL